MLAFLVGSKQVSKCWEFRESRISCSQDLACRRKCRFSVKLRNSPPPLFLVQNRLSSKRFLRCFQENVYAIWLATFETLCHKQTVFAFTEGLANNGRSGEEHTWPDLSNNSSQHSFSKPNSNNRFHKDEDKSVKSKRYGGFSTIPKKRISRSRHLYTVLPKYPVFFFLPILFSIFPATYYFFYPALYMYNNCKCTNVPIYSVCVHKCWLWTYDDLSTVGELYHER